MELVKVNGAVNSYTVNFQQIKLHKDETKRCNFRIGTHDRSVNGKVRYVTLLRNDNCSYIT